MTWIGKQSHYFEQLREFVPRDALAILEQQRQKVSKAIDDEVAAFGEALARSVKDAVDAQQAELKAEVETASSKLTGLLDELAKGKIDSEMVAKLNREIHEFEAKWKGLGKKIGDAAIRVVETSTGIPVSSILPR